MEEIIRIPTKDNYLIDGTLNYTNKIKEKLIIFVHGLSDNKDHRLILSDIPGPQNQLLALRLSYHPTGH